ncbi:hypothetical protein PF007_g30978 [Phytophthora fragariae]|uniref:Secreted protein n=1 Tax=Phytophthora fragariae TaxID=53985 RepID=A0A6A3PUE0_9STRA|nr:hypothetical protein PF007_g30978 [Phytophthora fragariae]
MGFCCVGSCACSVLCRCGVVLAKQQWKAEIRGKLSDATVESYSTNCPRSQCSMVVAYHQSQLPVWLTNWQGLTRTIVGVMCTGRAPIVSTGITL